MRGARGTRLTCHSSSAWHVYVLVDNKSTVYNSSRNGKRAVDVWCVGGGMWCPCSVPFAACSLPSGPGDMHVPALRRPPPPRTLRGRASSCKPWRSAAGDGANALCRKACARLTLRRYPPVSRWSSPSRSRPAAT